MKRQNLKAEVKVKRPGFTITEMLMVVVIIALVGSVGGGLYVGTYKRTLVEKAARGFLLTAKYARIISIEKQCQYKIQLDVENGGFCLATTLWNEETEQTQLEVVKDFYCRPVQFEGDVKFENIQITPINSEAETEEQQTIVFSPNGTAQSAVVQIGDGKTHYSISISAATGKAAMYFGTVEDVKIGSIDLDAE